MGKKISIEAEDGLVKSIGTAGDWVVFRTDDGDIITLEQYTLQRGLACFKVSQPNVASEQAEDVTCPFCGEADFDLIGLKDHLLNGRCSVFSETIDIGQEHHEASKDKP